MRSRYDYVESAEKSVAPTCWHIRGEGKHSLIANALAEFCRSLEAKAADEKLSANRLATAARIADALGVPLGELVG